MRFVVPTAYSAATHYLELARTAEECGWDCIAVSDHVAHPEKISSPYPYTEDGSLRCEEWAPWPEPLVSIAAMAAVTERLRFLTNVFVLPLRNPFLVAKAVATAAVLSGDRVALGIGVGWMKQEFDLLEQPFRARGRRADEMIEVLRKLWAGEMVEHHAVFYDFDRLRMLPAPAQRIPIYVGGISEAAFRRIGRLGDGWISDIHTTDELRQSIGRIRDYRAQYGRGDEPLEVFAACSDAFDADGYRRLEEIGVTHVMTMPWLLYGGSHDSLQDKKDGLRRFADDVFGKLGRAGGG